MSNKNENFELLERNRRELDLENGKIWINTVTFTEHATCSENIRFFKISTFWKKNESEYLNIVATLQA